MERIEAEFFRAFNFEFIIITHLEDQNGHLKQFYGKIHTLFKHSICSQYWQKWINNGMVKCQNVKSQNVKSKHKTPGFQR